MISVIVPYYRNPAMLRVHLHHWLQLYSEKVHETMKLIIVDDGSPEPALGICADFIPALKEIGAKMYRINVDIPWNRSGARNLGSHVAATPWLLHMDIDHILPPESAEHLALVIKGVKPDRWYRFRRFRNGAADETRNKDALPRSQKFGEIKPHCDSYLCTREMYWRAGGYNEDFSGCLGGGGPFLKQLELVAQPRQMLDAISLHVYTRDTCKDASDNTLSRDTKEFTRRRRALERAGKIKGHNPLRFSWECVL